MSAAPSRSFGSVGVAMVTPFTPSGEVDYDAARALAVSLVDDGADLILLSGTTGESPTTHTPEKQELIRQVKDALAGRAMVMAGAGSNDTAHAVRIGVASQEAGAEGLLINAPYYNRPSQEGVYRHINAVVEATDLPVMVYDIPGRTGVKITEVDAGDLAGARAVARRIRPLVQAIMGGGQGAVMAKEALLLQGRIPSAALRLPLVRAEADEVAALRAVLDASGLL